MEEIKSSKRRKGCTPHLFAILILLIALLIVAKFTFRGLPENPPFLAVLNPQPAVSPTPTPKLVDLTIVPPVQGASIGEPVNFDLTVSTNGISITAADVNIRFDQRKLMITSASPAAFFTDQVVFANTIDPKLGTLRVALGSLTPASASGRLFHLIASVLPTASESATLTILSSSRIGAVGSVQSVLGQTGSAQVQIRSY